MRRGDLGYETVDGADCFYNRETGRWCLIDFGYFLRGIVFVFLLFSEPIFPPPSLFLDVYIFCCSREPSPNIHIVHLCIVTSLRPTCERNQKKGEKVEMVIAPMDGLSIATEQITMDQSMASTPISSYI